MQKKKKKCYKTNESKQQVTFKQWNANDFCPSVDKTGSQLSLKEHFHN